MFKFSYEIDGVPSQGGKVYEGNRGIIESQIDLLCFFRDDGRVPSQQLLDDISAYQWMLDSDDALIERYLSEKEGNPTMPPREFWKKNRQ